MTPEEMTIKDYLHTLTGGVVNLSQQVVRRIVAMANTKGEAYVIKQRYNAQNCIYETVQIIKTTRERIYEEVHKVQFKHCVYDQFYRFECYEASGSHITTLYTINPNLF